MLKAGFVIGLIIAAAGNRAARSGQSIAGFTTGLIVHKSSRTGASSIPGILTGQSSNGAVSCSSHAP